MTVHLANAIVSDGVWEEIKRQLPILDLDSDLTATNNTHKEGEMATNENEVNVKYDTYTINGETGVDKPTAMNIIGLQYATELRNYLFAGKVKCLGEVQVKGKTNKKVYGPMEMIFKARDEHRTRGSDAAERFEIEIHENVLKAAITEIEGGSFESNNAKTLLKALKAAKNLTAERRAYNQSRKE